jgi:hypothetical protein
MPALSNQAFLQFAPGGLQDKPCSPTSLVFSKAAASGSWIVGIKSWQKSWQKSWKKLNKNQLNQLFTIVKNLAK